MKLAFLAYFQGSFNDCVFKWIDSTHCKITLKDNINHLVGSFVAEYDDNHRIINVTDETGTYSPDVNIPPQPVFMSDKQVEAAEPKTVTTIPLEAPG